MEPQRSLGRIADKLTPDTYPTIDNEQFNAQSCPVGHAQTPLPRHPFDIYEHRMSWEIHDQTARLVSSHWNVRVELSADQPSISISTPDNASPSESKLNLTPECLPKLNDFYVRNTDLIASYPEIPPHRFSCQLDIKLLSTSADLLRIDIWISVQTLLLNSYPAIEWQYIAPDAAAIRTLSSKLNTAGVYQLDHQPMTPTTGARVGALLDESASDQKVDWCLFVNPNDERETELQNVTSAADIKMRLFGGFMEKGVIRRARMQWLVSKSGIPRERIDALYSDFCNSPLPLTT